ncbi:hypothetical protein JXB37_08710 [candidate division WOR-3 bacterium]|nr:hypothetical protein [candidate division WOR-3 bacterium]
MFRRLLPLALLLGLGCSGMLFFRSGEDYFPLVRGSLWKFLAGADTSYFEVTGDSSVGGQVCTVVLVDYAPEFWLKRSGTAEIRRFYHRTLIRGGEEYELEARYGLRYLLPFVEGDSWAETFRDTVVVLGSDTIHYRHRLECRVAGVEPVSIPAGDFEQCYRLEFTELFEDEDTTVTAFTEWLAPGVGLVRRVSGTDELVLADYRIGP